MLTRNTSSERLPYITLSTTSLKLKTARITVASTISYRHCLNKLFMTTRFSNGKVRMQRARVWVPTGTGNSYGRVGVDGIYDQEHSQIQEVSQHMVSAIARAYDGSQEAESPAGMCAGLPTQTGITYGRVWVDGIYGQELKTGENCAVWVSSSIILTLYNVLRMEKWVC